MPAATSHNLDDAALVAQFAQGVANGQPVLLSNPNLRVEPTFDTVQLIAKQAGVVATAKLAAEPVQVSVRRQTDYWQLINQALSSVNFAPIGNLAADVYTYQRYKVPAGYQLHCTPSIDLWRVWWRHHKPKQIGIPLNLLIYTRENWFPVRDISCNQGTLYIKTLGKELVLLGTDLLIWLNQLPDPATPPASSAETAPRSVRPGLRGYYQPGAARRNGLTPPG